LDSNAQFAEVTFAQVQDITKSRLQIG